MNKARAIAVDKSSGLSRLVQIFVVPQLVRTAVTPEQLSAARLAVATLAALALAFGPADYYVAAALLVLAIVLDRSDGELARIRDQVSPASERHALVCDSFSHVLVFAGLGVGLRSGEYGLAAIGMGLVAGLAVALVPWMVRRLAAIDGKRADEFGGVAGLDADDILLLAMPLALWAGWAEGLLLLTAAAGPTFTTAFFLTHYRKFTAG